jgi:hypothetical protein
MKRVKFIGLALMVAFALSAVAVSSASAALVFNSTEVGKLTAKSLTTQTFVTKAGTVECTVVNLTGGTAALSSKVQEATIQYEKCKAFGISATVTPALYQFDANGTTTVLKGITITSLTCVVHVPATGNSSLKTVKFDNSGQNIILLPSVTGITYTALPGCANAGTASDGTYTGNTQVGLASGTGTIKWIA